MTETNKQIARLNENVLVKNIFMSKEKVRELKRLVQQIKRHDDLEEVVKDNDLMLADTELDLDEAQKRLELSCKSDTRFYKPSEDVEDGAAEEANWEEYNHEHIGH